MIQLKRELNLKAAISIVVGTIIGTGVFLKASVMTQYLSNFWLVMLAWTVGGILSFTGALVYAELGIRMPEAGGEYQYLKHSYGSFVSFLYAWMRFLIASPGSIAAYAVGAASFSAPLLGATLSQNSFATKGISILFIVLFTILNCFAVAFGGKIQTVMTTIKFVLIFGMSIFIFTLAPASHEITQVQSTFGWSAFGAALLASLWAYDGWNNLSMVAGEIENPSKNIPISLILGVFIVFIVYISINSSYFHALSIQQIMQSNSSKFPNELPVATKAVATFLGSKSVLIISICFVLSALGAMNGSILTGARVPYALSRDRLFFKTLANLNEKSSVPVRSVVIQGFISIILALSGTFDQLTDMVVFASWIFYALTASSLFIVRKKQTVNIKSTYHTPGYPIVPFIFVLCSIALLINTLITNPKESGVGLLIISCGIPFYFYFKSLKSQTPT